MKNPKVGIIMGSKSDLPVMQAAIDIMNEFPLTENSHKKSWTLNEIKTKTAAMGVRGTEFQTIYNPENDNVKLFIEGITNNGAIIAETKTINPED